jgi:hypothetical protein
VAGVVGLELRNVVAKYPFERSHRFPGPSRLLATETIRVGAKVRARLIVIELASEMLLRSQRKLHHAFQELVRRQADEVVHDELLGV